MSETLTRIERAHLETLEMATLALRRRISAALASGLDDNRGTLEIRIGEMQAILTVMAEHGEVSQDACSAHAKNFYEALKVR
ncbi:hypothetical protein [Asaia bogorensis]|uniref:hypothetical protein n=1 Tax=Asaia bogorensis TaxID=91915 RepID=UPI000EFCA37C|nr:hypothetical protein [Asaia bogorensis]